MSSFSRQIQGNQILPPQSPQYQQMQNVNLNKSISQSAYQGMLFNNKNCLNFIDIFFFPKVRPGIQPISGVPQQVQYQAINDPNQVRLVQSQTQMVQLPRQMSPMGQQQRPPPHLQQIKQVTGPQTMMRIPQQSQFFQTQTQPNQDQMMHDVQGPAIRMMAGQQMVHLREQNPQLIMNVQQPQGGSGMIGNISQQQIVFQHPNNQVGLNQRPQVQQVMVISLKVVSIFIKIFAIFPLSRLNLVKCIISMVSPFAWPSRRYQEFPNCVYRQIFKTCLEGRYEINFEDKTISK